LKTLEFIDNEIKFLKNNPNGSLRPRNSSLAGVSGKPEGKAFEQSNPEGDCRAQTVPGVDRQAKTTLTSSRSLR